MGAKLKKTIIFLTLGLLVVAVILTIVANRYRDSIALELANRVLADSDVNVTDVSVESISAETIKRNRYTTNRDVLSPSTTE